MMGRKIAITSYFSCQIENFLLYGGNLEPKDYIILGNKLSYLFFI